MVSSRVGGASGVLDWNNVVDVPFAMILPRHAFCERRLNVGFECGDVTPEIFKRMPVLFRLQCRFHPVGNDLPKMGRRVAHFTGVLCFLMLADATTATILAQYAPSPMFADAGTPTVLALAAAPSVFTYASSATLRTSVSYPFVFAVGLPNAL